MFNFVKNDILLFGRESAGVPKEIHDKIKNHEIEKLEALFLNFVNQKNGSVFN